MAGSSSEDEVQQSLVQRAVSSALAPVQIATSRPALKAYLSTILFLAASLTLLAISTTAYLLFYYNFIPQVGLRRVIHLQYADGPFPHSTTYLTTSSSTTTSSLTSLQPYDITIHLHLPRTPTNLAAGNFMLDLSLMSPSTTSAQALSVTSLLAPLNTTSLLARSRRPAILPYESALTSLTNNVLALPLHALSLRDIDATTLSIPMFEKVTFARGQRNLPASARLEIQTQPHTQAALLGGQAAADIPQHVPLQVYSASIEFHARFRGLRWLMYNWRVTSFLAFTSAFYCVALISTGVAWGVVTLWSPSDSSTAAQRERKRIKQEGDDGDRGLKKATTNGHATQPTIKNEPADEEGAESGEESALSLSNLSDNATTFPTLGRQMPIRYPLPSGSASGSGRIKPENLDDDDEVSRIDAASAMEPLTPATTAGEFAEDEDEDGDGDGDGGDVNGDRGRDRDRDSGIGTSMEESAREAVGLHQRRRGGGGGRWGSSGSGAKR